MSAHKLQAINKLHGLFFSPTVVASYKFIIKLVTENKSQGSLKKFLEVARNLIVLSSIDTIAARPWQAVKLFIYW